MRVLGRRTFLRGATATSIAAFAGLRSSRAAAEPPPETTTLKLLQFPSGCQGPLYAADELLRSEGFTDVRYVKVEFTEGVATALLHHEPLESRTADLGLTFSAPLIGDIDRGVDLVTVGGRSEEHTSELQSLRHLVCRLLLEKKKKKTNPFFLQKKKTLKKTKK